MSLQKELEKITKYKEKNFDDSQEFYEAIMNYINDEGDEFFETLSPEAQSWFNENVDAISSGEDLKGFDEEEEEDIPEEKTEEKELDEEEEEADEEEEEEEDELDSDEIDPEDYDEIKLEDAKVNQTVLVMLDDDEGVEGELIKKLKVALRILNDKGEEIRIPVKKVQAIYLKKEVDEDDNVDEESSSKVEEEKPVKKDKPKAKTKAKEVKDEVKEEKPAEEKISKDDTAKEESEGGYIVPESVKDEIEECIKSGVKPEFKAINPLPESNININVGVDPKDTIKQVLYHISQVLRLTSDLISNIYILLSYK